MTNTSRAGGAPTSAVVTVAVGEPASNGAGGVGTEAGEPAGRQTMDNMVDRLDAIREQAAARVEEKRRNIEAKYERERKDRAWQRELEERADGKDPAYWVRWYEV